MRRLAYLLLLTPVLSAQNGTLEGPSLGVLWHAETRTLRPMLGIFGAARLGEPFATTRPIQSADVSPYSRYAIVLAGEGEQRQAALATWTGGSVEFIPLEGVPPSFERVVFSPSAKAAGISAGSSFYRITGLPGQPAVSAVAVPASSRLVAVSDSGTLLYSVAGESASSLYRDSAGAAELLASAVDVRAASFDPESENAFVVTGDQVLTFSGAVAGDPLPAVANVVALAVTPATMVTATPGGLLLFPRGAPSPPERVDCECDPTLLRTLRDGLFQLTTSSAELVWVLDVNARAVRFVPALPPAPEAAQ